MLSRSIQLSITAEKIAYSFVLRDGQGKRRLGQVARSLSLPLSCVHFIFPWFEYTTKYYFTLLLHALKAAVSRKLYACS